MVVLSNGYVPILVEVVPCHRSFHAEVLLFPLPLPQDTRPWRWIAHAPGRGQAMMTAIWHFGASVAKTKCAMIAAAAVATIGAVVAAVEIAAAAVVAAAAAVVIAAVAVVAAAAEIGAVATAAIVAARPVAEIRKNPLDPARAARKSRRRLRPAAKLARATTTTASTPANSCRGK